VFVNLELTNSATIYMLLILFFFGLLLVNIAIQYHSFNS